MEQRFRVDAVIDRIQATYGTFHLTSRELSRGFNISPRRLGVVFRRRTVITFRHFQSDFRMANAAELLLKNDIRVKEVAAAVGYTASSNFVRDFRLKYGLRPTEARNAVRKAYVIGGTLWERSLH